MEDAKAARDAALTAHEARRKELIARWTEFFLNRLQQINPDVEIAHIDPADFTTHVKERDQPDKAFTESSVAGSPKVVTNVAMLLALRDLGRTEATVHVPPLLIVDSPLADLGAVDQATGLRLIDTLIDVAGDPSADGYGCQVIAATNDPLPRAYPRASATSPSTPTTAFSTTHPARTTDHHRHPHRLSRSATAESPPLSGHTRMRGAAPSPCRAPHICGKGRLLCARGRAAKTACGVPRLRETPC